VVGGTNLDGTAQFKFMLLDKAGAQAYWSNQGLSTNIAPPSSSVSLSVARGLYSVMLGDTNLSRMAEIPASIFTNDDVRLRVWVSTGGDFQALSPDVRIAPVGYAFRAQSAVTADRANSVVNFSGSLAGDVTGSQAGTVVSRVGGASAASIASGASLANAATSANVAETIVRRDAGGNFSAGNITGIFSGTGAGLIGLNAGNLSLGTLPDGRLSVNVPLLNASQTFSGVNTFEGATRLTNGGNVFIGAHAGDGSGLSNLPPVTIGAFTGALDGDVTGTQTGTVVARVGGTNAAVIAAGANAANSATSSNAPDSIVRRDASGNFSAGTITGIFSGTGPGLAGLNAGNLSAGTLADGRLSANVPLLNGSQTFSGVNTFAGATRLTNVGNVFIGAHAGDGSGLSNLPPVSVSSFTGVLNGDVTGRQTATVVAQVGGASAASVATGVGLANSAAANNLPGTLVRRDTSGNFSAGIINGTFSGTHVGDGSGLTNISMAAGALLVSDSPQDSALVAGGYRLTTTIPSPAWVNGATTGMPDARYGHTAVWDGTEMIVWGGTFGSGQYAAGGASYLPGLDQWQWVSTINAPSPRSDHTAVWMGSGLIIWGGANASGYVSTGGKLTASTGLWTAISTSAAPSARSGHVAVWMGAHMLVWGGINANGLLNDGAIYNPATDQWTALGIANAPAARSGAKAVWAGDRLIVWGGQGAAGELGDGAELIFAAAGVPSQWIPLAAVNAPVPRQGHSAVWTGSKLIVWGGRNAAGPLADGAAFDPASNGWATLATTNAPAARYDHAAVWTGQEMLIVAGSGAAGELASGCSYDPLTGKWTPLSGSGGPLARTGSTAIWAGSELIIFGGRANGQPVGSPQRLVPQPAWYFYRKI